MYTSTLFVFCMAVAASLAATPFFESPHNERASAFYKAPANGLLSQSAPVINRPAPAYRPQAAPAYRQQAAPAYRPQAAPAYRPQAAPAYRPQAAPAYRPSPSYKAQPSYGGGYNKGATSYQNVRLEVGEQAYRQPQKSQY